MSDIKEKQQEYIDKTEKIYHELTDLCGDGRYDIFSYGIKTKLVKLFNDAGNVLVDMKIEADPVAQQIYAVSEYQPTAWLQYNIVNNEKIHVYHGHEKDNIVGSINKVTTDPYGDGSKIGKWSFNNMYLICSGTCPITDTPVELMHWLDRNVINTSKGLR